MTSMAFLRRVRRGLRGLASDVVGFFLGWWLVSAGVGADYGCGRIGLSAFLTSGGADASFCRLLGLSLRGYVSSLLETS